MIKPDFNPFLLNLFILDENKKTSVSYYVDTHVVKMALEACQCLCTVHHLCGTDTGIPYRSTHEKHPVVKWILEDIEHYFFTLGYANLILQEYTLRYNKHHLCEGVADWLENNTPKLPDNIFDQSLVIPLGISDAESGYKFYKPESLSESVMSHRRYYIEKKSHLAKWSVRRKPYWYPSVRLSTANIDQIEGANNYWEREVYKR